MKSDFIYDEYDRIINKREITDGLKDFDPAKEVKRPYRWRSNKKTWRSKSGHWPGYRYNIKKNKTYVAKLMEYYDLFPADGRLRATRDMISWWSDDFGQRSTGRTWKDQSKKRKQWM